MTTAVTVDAHAGWPVRVEKIDPKTGQSIPGMIDEIVKPGTRVTFHIHDSLAVIITELKMEKADGVAG